jgi:hypothetical protein
VHHHDARTAMKLSPPTMLQDTSNQILQEQPRVGIGKETGTDSIALQLKNQPAPEGCFVSHHPCVGSTIPQLGNLFEFASLKSAIDMSDMTS